MNIDDLISQGLIGPGGNSAENTIYLGGMPSMSEDSDVVSTWRETFIDICGDLVEEDDSFKFANPCEGMYEPITGLFKRENANAWRYSDELITDKRVHLLLNSNILVFNFLDPTEDLATLSYECGFGFALKTKYLITIGESSNSLIKLSSSFIAKDLYEAARYCLYISSKSRD